MLLTTVLRNRLLSAQLWSSVDWEPCSINMISAGTSQFGTEISYEKARFEFYDLFIYPGILVFERGGVTAFVFYFRLLINK